MTGSRRPEAVVVATKPAPGPPRPYEFPPFERHRLASGLGVIAIHLPGRPLVSASLIARRGAAEEPATAGGATVLMARALSEGTALFDAIELVEAAERLGASLHAEAGWDATSASVEVPAERFGPALELLVEMVAHPTFPANEVDRLREERLNDLLQARADPRRRVEEAFAATIYAPASPYHRPLGGVAETVGALTAGELRVAHGAMFDPAAMTLIVGGDLNGLDVPALAGAALEGWERDVSAPAESPSGSIVDAAATDRRVVHAVHRPGAVQTEIRIGRRGLARRIADFHAVGVMSAILGGLFDSRLNRKLREEKGYTYGAGAGFDFRRGAGPFSARAAVDTANTVPAILETLAELDRMREAPVTERELAAARDYLVGVFPLRFETPGAVVGALSGLVVHELPDDELARYRPAIAAVSADDVLAAARAHLDVEAMAIVLVGDVDAFLPALESAGVGAVEVERDPEPDPAGERDG